MKKVDEDSRLSDQYMWEETRVDLTEITRKQTVLLQRSISIAIHQISMERLTYFRNKLTLLELSACKYDIAVLI